jgi:peptidylprolyl isomerase
MNTKSVIGIIIAAIIIIGIAVWVSKTPVSPAQPPAPTMAPVVTTQTPAATSPAVTTPATTASGSTISSTTTKDGMKIEITKQGTGPAIVDGQTAVMLYTGTLADGTVFDSTANRDNAPFSFTLGAGQVIPGWDEGILGMKVGEERTLVIPPALAYGAAGYPPVIPANATLTFKVTLVAIK